MRKSYSKFFDPFIARYPEYKLLPQGGMICSIPIGHVLNGFHIQETSTNTTYYVFYSACTLISAPNSCGGFPVEIGSVACHFSTLDISYSAKVMEAMERWSEIMKMIDNFSSLLEFASNREYPHGSKWPAFSQLGPIYAAMGDFAAAKKKVANAYPYFSRLSPKTQNLPSTRRYYEGLRALELALDGDPKTVFAILREWEATNVRENGFEPYWTPAPFPGEIALGLVNAP
jgi:hypothetical protein